MWLTFIITLLVAALSGMGVGSAGLFVTWLTVVLHVPQMTAQGINLIFFIFSSGASLVIHTFRTPLLWQTLIPLILAGALGSFFGVSLAALLPQLLLRRIFGSMLIFLGAFELFLPRKHAK